MSLTVFDQRMAALERSKEIFSGRFLEWLQDLVRQSNASAELAAALDDVDALSVIGNPTNAAADASAITAGTDGHVLRRLGTALGFGQIATGGITDNAVTLAKLATQAALSVLANATNGVAVPTALVAGSDGHVLRRGGTALAFGQLAIGAFADAVITFAKLQNFDALSVLGRSANSAGVGDEIAAGTDGHILRRSGATLGFGKILANFITGTATNDNATAGDIGEHQSASVAAGSVGSWSSGTVQNITSVSLTAGDWDVSGVVAWSGNGLTGIGGVSASIATSSGTEPTAPDPGRATVTAFPVSDRGISMPVGPTRMSLSATTTVYLTGSIRFTGSTTAPTAGGVIRARRVR